MAVLKPSIAGTHAELMRQMRSPDGFDPMPPSQHSYLLDVDESATNRAIAWLWSKTIRPGRGHSRSPYARDERGALRHTHAAADLGWSVSNTRTTFEKLAAQGRIRIEPNGKIWLCGDVPEPRRTKSEAEKKELCTYFLEPRFAQYLQGLDEKERSQRETEFQQLQKYKRKLAAEALAGARSLGEELEQAWQREIGYTPKAETRGRPKLSRPSPMLQLSLIAPPQFVHNPPRISEHNSTPISDQKQNGSEQNHHPYVSEVESFRELATAKNNEQKENEDAELEAEIKFRIEQAGKLSELAGKPLDNRTVRTIRTILQQLEQAELIKPVLDVIETKCWQLSRHPRKAGDKTWGWVVGLVRSEVENRLAETTPAQLLATIRTTAAAKGMR